ncbi:Bug family tripartite tricarboxylate transporter substrate binding protein [Ottowia thiooxydans]|uniref:Bug family tripartite tricarboxylate transporter substrate binding protein n=1 Tax=Ottowia thiooxydans TaxID=219182 RepID=UPI00040ACB5B|nr:tripartite tricarboxylate transporter substrate binding protein [Ottowia thiooxydans]
MNHHKQWPQSGAWDRRRFMIAMSGTVAAGLPSGAWAQDDFPSKPIRIMVPFPAGGPTDIVARVVGQALSERLRQTVTIENRPGASGMIGADAVAKAAPDGYTLLINVSGHLVNPALFSKMPHDPLKDFQPITNVATTPIQLVISADSPVRSFDDLLKLVRSQPGKHSFASSSNGTPGHLTGELLKTVAKLDVLHVPYKGSAPALTDVMGGQVTYMLDSMPSSIALVKSGRLRSLAVTSPRRVDVLPDVPTFAELNYPGVNLSSWYGLWGPAKLPRAVTARIYAEVKEVLAMPDVRKRITDVLAEPVGDTPEQFSAFCASEAQRYAGIVRAAGIRLE